MRRHSRIILIGVLSTASALMLGSVGCKKKEQAVIPPAPVEQPAAQAAAPESSAPAPQVVEPPPSTDANQALTAAQSALKTRDYDKAAATLLFAQQQQLNQQQAEAVRAQMVQLQKDLVNAIGSGDANAKAAADRLRAAHSAH